MVMNFRNSKLEGNSLARLSRPVGDSDNLYVVLLCETRNMKGSGVATGSDQADADLFSDMKRLTLALAVFTTRLPTALTYLGRFP